MPKDNSLCLKILVLGNLNSLSSVFHKTLCHIAIYSACMTLSWLQLENRGLYQTKLRHEDSQLQDFDVFPSRFFKEFKFLISKQDGIIGKVIATIASQAYLR